MKTRFLSSDTRKNVALAALSTVVFLLVFVGAYEAYKHVRYRQWKADFMRSSEWYDGLTRASSDPVLLWEYRPNKDYRDPALGTTIHTNRYGFRDDDYPSAAKPPNVYRLAFIGDSVVLGLKVAADSAFVSRINAERTRTCPDSRFRAMNFGVDGYNTLQVSELLRARVLAFEPDAVVYVMSLNDFDFEDASGRKILFFREPRSFFLLKLRKLARRPSRADYYEYYFRRNRRAVFEQIEGMRTLLEASRVRFSVAVLPVFVKDAGGFEEYPHRSIHEEIVSELKRRGVAVIDLLGAFREAGGTPAEYSVDVWHPNARGHALLAQVLYRFAVPTDSGCNDLEATPGEMGNAEGAPVEKPGDKRPHPTKRAIPSR